MLHSPPARLLLVLTSLTSLAAARIADSLPEDPYAFPKFRVTFLSQLPLLNETAQRWVKDGLRGGELEFLDKPWQHLPQSQRKEIEGGSSIVSDTPPVPSSANYTLELMKMGPKDSYLCYIPKPSDRASHPLEEEEPDLEAASSKGWALLQPLAGTCLYHQQGWFTYSYCHNKEIRQFKEAAQPAALDSGGYKVPEEDPEWEAYTLGKAPNPGADLSVADPNAHARNVELAHQAGSHYLVQRWGDGTICDKTGRSREVEVQFHCSMTMTDSILLVKETKTCSYVLVINTPRLCAEPGFLSRRDKGDENEIRCREVVHTLPPPVSDSTADTEHIPDGDRPSKIIREKAKSRPIPPKVQIEGKKEKDSSSQTGSEVWRAAIEAFLNGQNSKSSKFSFDEYVDDKDGIIFEVIEEGDLSDMDLGAVDRITEALRQAGLNVAVANERGKEQSKEDKPKEKEDSPKKQRRPRKGNLRYDEL